MRKHISTIAAAGAALTFALAASAAAQTLYQPSSESRGRYGYAETQIDINRVRVSFSGNSRTDRESVELNLLYRAAETTLQRGFDYFVVVDHNVEQRTDYDRMGPPRMASYNESSRYQAVSDIVMFNGVRPPVANAFDARTVRANLATRITRPS